ncbi:MAG TPA: hypothetical protein VKV26_23235 [Dehalococcoidia bacterium]|nr:hypothetical protein [Dehalococcoidia bacterium]
MATTNSARSPKRIRRWLQTSAVGSVLVSSSLFGLIAAQSMQTTAHAASTATQPASTAQASSDTASTASTKTTASAATATPSVQARTRAS